MITLPVLMTSLNLGVGWLYYPPGKKGKTVGLCNHLYWLSPFSRCYDSSLLPFKSFAYFESTGIFSIQLSVHMYVTVCDLLDRLTKSTGSLGTGVWVRVLMYIRIHRDIALSEMKPYTIVSNCNEAICNFGERSPVKKLQMPFTEFWIIFFLLLL